MGLIDGPGAPEASGARDAESHGNKLLKLGLLVLLVYTLLPVFGVGRTRNATGDVLFELWYLIGFLVISFFVMHELITPLPPKDEA